MSPSWCGDGRPIVVIPLGGHKARLHNEAPSEVGDVVSKVRDMLRYRAEKLVFVATETDVSFGDVAEVVDRLYPETGVISLITAQVAKRASRSLCIEPSCGDCSRIVRLGHPAGLR